MSLITLIFAAFIAGILGSIHCISMCGGIACGVGQLNDDEQKISFVKSIPSPFIISLKFNLGRILSYTFLGALFAYVGHHIIHLSDSRTILSVFRYFSAVLIALIGFKYVFGIHLIDVLEKGGFRVWSLIKNKINLNKYLSSTSIIPLGIVWGFLPCGLIYTMLLTASSAESIWGGAMVMFAFGLGTLPAMLSISSISRTFKESINIQWMKTAFGIALIMLALLIVALEINAPQSELCQAPH